jgi:hypothetical protein
LTEEKPIARTNFYCRTDSRTRTISDFVAGTQDSKSTEEIKSQERSRPREMSLDWPAAKPKSTGGKNKLALRERALAAGPWLAARKRKTARTGALVNRTGKTSANHQREQDADQGESGTCADWKPKRRNENLGALRYPRTLARGRAATDWSEKMPGGMLLRARNGIRGAEHEKRPRRRALSRALAFFLAEPKKPRKKKHWLLPCSWKQTSNKIQTRQREENQTATQK